MPRKVERKATREGKIQEQKPKDETVMMSANEREMAGEKESTREKKITVLLEKIRRKVCMVPKRGEKKKR